MKSAIVYIRNQKELDLSKTRVFDRFLVDYIVNKISRLDLDNIYVVGADYNIKGTINRDSLEEIYQELEDDNGKTLLLSPFYPFIKKEDYRELLSGDTNTVFVCNGEVVPVFALNNINLRNFEKTAFSAVELLEERTFRYTGNKDLYKLTSHIKENINNSLMEKGVTLLDPSSTIIGFDVKIDKNTVIEANVEITGKSVIGKNNHISKGSTIKDSVIGDNNEIIESRIIASSVGNDVSIGPCAIVENNSLVKNKAVIGSYVKLNNTKLSYESSIEHMSYIGDAIIEDRVKIGSGVLTVNNDGLSTHGTIIKSHATIGSNVTLIAPVVIGEYALLAAGSTIDSDVSQGDMAISRLYQQNKKGYGYKHYKEDK